MAVLPTDSSTNIKLIIILIYSVGDVLTNPSVNFEFRTKIFNDPPYFSRSVGKSVGNMTRSKTHLMHNPLKFTRSVDNFIGKIDPPTTCRRI
jgi:hypothetical protein